MSESAWTWLGLSLAAFAFVANTNGLILAGIALSQARAHSSDLLSRVRQVGRLGELPGVSIIVPAHNEGSTIASSIGAVMSLSYPDYEVVVVDDGSDDATTAVLIDAFEMTEARLVVDQGVDVAGKVRTTWRARQSSPTLVMVCKEHAGKAAALNAGINAASKDLVCTVDADSVLEPDALLHLVQPFIDLRRPAVAAGGVVRVANGAHLQRGVVTDVPGSHRWLPAIQAVEYVRAFLIGRVGWSALGGLLVISGAFGLFRREVLLAIGGLTTDCVGEDLELVIRVHRWLGEERQHGRRHNSRVAFVPHPVAWTEVPEDLATLARQRRRWHRGLAQALTLHRSMLLRRRYGVVGMLALPYFWVFELLAPLVELVSLLYLALSGLGAIAGAPNVGHGIGVGAVALITASMLYAIIVSIIALLVDLGLSHPDRGTPAMGTGQPLRLLIAVVAEQLGYRQINVWWRLQALIGALTRTTPQWGEMARRGFNTSGHRRARSAPVRGRPRG